MLPTIALLVLTGAATPAQIQQATAALYSVEVSYEAWGSFQRAADDGTAIETTDHVSSSLTLGSAFAVSPDGWLMTARHVVDTEMKIADLCVNVRQAWAQRATVHTARLVVLFADIAGMTYGMTAVIHQPDAHEDLCSGAPYRVTTDPTMTARLVALDDAADLALVRIDTADVLYLPLSGTRPVRWSEVFALGYTDPGVRSVRTGTVAIRCEDAEGECIQNADGSEQCPKVRVTRTTAAVDHGMSGGPQVGPRGVIGVTTMKAEHVPVGFAVPSAYALKWYRHVRWPAKYARPSTVCVPAPEP